MSLRDKPPYRIDELAQLLGVNRKFVSRRMTPAGSIRWWKVGKTVFLDFDDVERELGNPRDTKESAPPPAAVRLLERLGG